MSILERIEQILREVLGDPALRVNSGTRREDVAGWDSFAHVQVILAIEEAFQAHFRTEEVTSFETVGDFVAAVQKPGGSA